MKLKDLALLEMSKKEKAMKAFSKRTPTIGLSYHSRSLFSSFIDNSSTTYFHVTNTTRERIKNMPVDNITGQKLSSLKTQLSKGLVFFNDGLHFLYVIKENGVYILTSNAKDTRISDDPQSTMANVVNGFLYFDFYTDYHNHYINNVLDIERNNDNLLKEEIRTKNILNKITKQLKEGNLALYEKYQTDYKVKYELTKTCLQAFLFIHFAKVINTTRISQTDEFIPFAQRVRNKKKSNIDIIEVNTLYDERLKVINPFSVRGHFRNQPTGKGRESTKLIYIDAFMKSGYTRKATVEKIKLD